MAGKIDKRASQFLQKDSTNPKVIIFYTVGSEEEKPDWAQPDIQVDAVASASIHNHVEERAKELTTLIEKRF
jgi:hypothetical protein